MGDPVKDTINNNTGNGDPVTMALFKSATKVADTQFIPKSPEAHYTFNPEAPEYEYIKDPTPYTASTSNIDYFNSARQSKWTKAGRSLKQFGANVVSSVGQGLANTFDLISLGKTVKGELTGSEDDFTSSLFGISTKDMQDWSNGIEERNRIFEEHPGSFDPSNFGWWAKQFASAGTGVGMVIEALGTTVAIEAMTGGAGTATALSKLGNLFSKAKNANILKEGLDIAKGLKSVATLYGTISRYSESRMEAQNTYDQVYDDLSQQKDEEGNQKFNEDQKKYIASQGARRTFNWNVALLPLDILAYRTMIFNPVSGSATGLLEKGFDKIGNKIIRKGVQGTVFAALEGSEEGFQQVGQDEGLHYAKVLSGEDDGKSFVDRFSDDVKSNDFWNNFAGGVLGSPIIGGVMHLANKAMTGNKANRLDEVHKDYIENIGKMNNALAGKIKDLESNGKTQEASILRRQFNASKALSALHLDAMTDKDTAFDAHKTFIETTLQELEDKNNKADVLYDLGFHNTTPEQVETIKKEFKNYLDDANEISGIYNNLKDKYNKNFLPQITQQHFQLNRLIEAQKETNTKLALESGKLYQFDQLSSHGKDIYNIEYQLQALQAEKKRLQELYKSTDDEFEKTNIQETINLNKFKLEATNKRLDDISKDEEYNKNENNTKGIDDTILGSALRDKDYTQSVYEKERLENEILLQRKNISLWNSSKYTAEKNKKSISKAKTKVQVEATQESIQKNKEDVPEVKNEIEEKKNELLANEAAELVQQQKQQADDNTIGNANLFEDDSALIDGIKKVAQGDPENPNPNPNAEVYLFSPAEYDFNKSTDEAKNQVINGVRGLISKLGDKNSFEDLVRHVVKVQGVSTADNIFNALKYGWEKSGMPVEDYDAVYNKVFNNPLDELLSGTKGLTIQTGKQLEQESKKTTDVIIAKQNQPEGFDTNNQPVYKYTGIITNEASPKMAFVTRLTETIQTKNDDGTIQVSHDYTSEELNTGDHVDSLQLLDPDKFNEGTEMVIRVPDNFSEIKIPIYNVDGTKGKAMTFGQYVALNNLSPESKEYQDKIPMIIYRKGGASNEKGIAFVHDIGWYHPLRFNQEKVEDMQTAISNTREIRKSVLDNKGKSDVTITGKRQTTFAGLKTKVNEIVTLKEANPQTQLTVALTTDSLSTSSKNVVFPNNKTGLINQAPFAIGQVFDVRRYGKKDGIDTYIALPILRSKLDDISKSSVLQAINIYANRSNTQVRAQHDPIAKSIKDSMGIDILSPQGIESYLQHFITTFNTEKAKTNEDVERQASAKLKAGTPYIAFIAGGNLVFGKAGESVYIDKQEKKINSYYINPNSVAPSTIALNSLFKSNFINWYEQNLDLDNLNKNKPIVTIDRNLNTATTANSYNDFLLDRYRTNIKSFNIGTAENPNYVTNIQPVITYELTDKLKQGLSTNESIASDILKSNTQGIRDRLEDNEGEHKQLSDIERQIIAQAKKDLGNDFNIGKIEASFSPAELTEEQKQYVTASINRIAGLTPDQQFDIVDFMYNQITAMVNLDTKVVTEAEVAKQVDNAFQDIIVPLRRDYQEKIEIISKMLGAKGTSSDLATAYEAYKYRVAKIDAIENNFDVLKEEAYNRVAKYTGITENTILTETLNDEEFTEQNPINDRDDETNNRDFWTDVFEENPEDKLSYSMRRFFGQVREYDKQGQPATGFLGLPTYTGADNIIRTLMVTLADVPSDFDTMIAKLESRKEAIPWMQEIVDKLKGTTKQKKSQFVTVMSNTSVRPKFMMIQFNQRTGSWKTKIYDTALNGVADAVKSEWRANAIDSDLITSEDEGHYTLNTRKADILINQFDSWKGKTLKEIETDMSPLRPTINQVKPDKSVEFIATGTLLQELKTNIIGKTDRVKFSMKGQEFQISKSGDKYQIAYLKQGLALNTKEGRDTAEQWLKEFGITLTPKTTIDLFTNGLFHNYKIRKPHDLFTTDNGLFQILYNKLNRLKEGHDFTEEGDNLLDDSVINSLANLEAQYNDTNTPFGYRDGKKSLFALSLPKFITDRTKELKEKDSTIVKQLQSISFSSNSLWLKLLSDDKFRTLFNISHLGLTAFKQQGKKNYRDNGINKLSDLDHELTKLGMFWDSTQGDVSYTTTNAEGKEVTLKTYPGTNIGLRMATMFSPTMSDKKVMTLITTAVLDLTTTDLSEGKGISDEVVKTLFEQTVRPELQRMIKFYQNGGKTNIKDYDKGAGMFLLLPELNNIEYTSGLRLIDAIKHRPFDFTQDFVEGNEDLMKAFNQKIKDYVNNLTKEKIEVWEKNGLVSRTEDSINLNFFDKKYSDKFRGTNIEKANMIATDFVVNSLIANANSFMTMAGDPAFYYKSKASDHLTIAKDTFVNAGKRLALLIAPGTTLSNSENEKYLQVFLNDRQSEANNIEYLKQLLGEEQAAAYSKIEASDAQEYTTWKEHLDVLAKLGKTPDNLLDITTEDIQEAREIFASGKPKSQLSGKQTQLLTKVMQPIKPVTTGQIYDPAQDVMRTVYIKSSSFPLIPQLTAGMEIDKLRVAMEKLESTKKMNVRASYQSANKSGALSNPIEIWNSEGRINEDAFKDISNSSLVLDRKNFRIQQEVPFKSNKQGDDTITLGTQLMKLLFGDEIMTYGDFNYNGKNLTGKELHSEYNQLFDKLVQEKKNQLFSELGLDSNGVPIDLAKSMQKIQSVLKDEAIKRGYPLQDIEGLTLNSNGEFNLPLWASSNSNRYESMLNSIISNRMVRMKFPGNSFVVGSEEGFKVQEGLKNVDQTRIIYTSSWNGKELQASTSKNSAQILVASKFKDAEGNLIDLFEGKGDNRKYVTKTEDGWRLKEDMIDKDLLSMTSFRIPTSGLSSASQIEIVGFIPYESGDLMIVPKNFVKQKGLDFDVDKENSYQLWQHITDDGKFEVLNESHRSSILSAADNLLKGKTPEEKILRVIFGKDYKYEAEDIEGNKFLTKLNSKITEKILQNEIIKINKAVLTNPNKEIQAKINKVLNTDFSEQQANFIDELVNSNKNSTYWTPLSDEYQKQKMFLGASGRIGTGAYALDTTFHSLAQQIALDNKPINLIEIIGEGDDTQVISKIWRFGNRKSNNQLGGTKTVDGDRSISDRLNEAAQIAVDNEKLQVMGRVGLNDFTLDVDKVFNLTGLDKGKDGNSISYLFLSQPIIKEYVDRMRNANSNMADFVKGNKEENIFNDLITKYDPTTDTSEDNYEDRMSDLMTNENFIFAIKAETPDGKLQGAVLRRFMDMKKYGIAIRGIQTSINADSKGLGKSFFDVIEKRNALNRLGRDSNMILGASNLIGDYELKEDLDEDQQTEAKDKGYIDIGEFLVKPNTQSGSFNINGISTAYDLWSRFFPYDAPVTQKAFTEILSIIGSESMGDTRLIEYKQQIFQGMKKYFSASKLNGIISAEDDINEERKRLFIDSDTNTSLAKYIKTLKQTNGNSVIDNFVKTNKLINRFEFDIQKNGQPSLIKFNNATGEEFDEQYLYESLATLIEVRRGQDVLLPNYNSSKYSLDKLAQDLIAYSYLGNATQEAIQFTKYVPVSYLNTVGYSNRMRDANRWLQDNPNVLGIRLGDPNTEAHLVSEYTMQFVQHNPERVKSENKFNSKDFSKYINKNQDGTFTFKDNRKPTFISVYDPSIPKGEKKFRLYWFDGSKYTNVPVLGTFGMDEYQPRNTIGKSLVNGRVKVKAAPQAIIHQDAHSENQTSLFNIEAGTTHDIVSAIANNNTTKYTQLAKALLPYIGNINTVVEDIPQYGKYYHETNIIGISSNITNNSELLAQTFLHELVHGLTVNNLKQFITNPENPEVNEDAPQYVSELVRIYNNLREGISKDKLDTITERVAKGQAISTEEKEALYGFTNVYEFIAQAMTSKGFQEALNQIPYQKSGKSFLDKFKELVKSVLTALGVKFDENFTAAHAISNIFTLIEQTNKKEDFDPYQTFYDDTLSDPGYDTENYDVDFNRLMDDPNDKGVSFAARERDYINRSTDSNTDSQINSFSPATEEGIYSKFIQFKKTQLSESNKRLNEIERKRRAKDITKEELTKLNNLEREINLHVEGSYELGVKGLRQEIAELEKNPNIEAVTYYVEKDLKRLDKLANSNNIDDLREAQRIIDFYDLAGTFKRGTENPFFTQEEMFLDDEDGNPTTQYRLSDSTMQKFKDWRDKAIQAQNTVEKRKEEITTNQINTDTSVIKTYGKNKNFSFDEIVKDDTGLKDTDWISMWTMDVTNGIFSHNGVMPQVMFSYLTNSFEKKLKWARDIEEKIDKLNPKVQKELIRLGYSLRGVGILGLRGGSYQPFKEITKEGNETGGLIQKFNKEFYDEQASINNQFQNAFDQAISIENYNVASATFNKAFEEKKRWKRNNTIILEGAKIPEISGSTPENEAYKKSLVDLIGEKEYKNQVDKQTRLADKYQTDRQAIIDTLLVEEGKTNYDDLSDKAKSDLSAWEVNRSPKMGVEDYYSVQGIFYGNRKTNNFMNYNVFIPRKLKPNISIENNQYKFANSTTPTGHHNSSFEVIENSPVLSEFHDIMKEVCETIRENMPYELQKSMAVNTIPSLMKTSSEMIADKNMGILKSLFQAFKHLIERIRVNFGVIRQSELSYAALDPITGKANYKVNDTFIQGNARAVKQRMAIEGAKFVQAYNFTRKTEEKMNKIRRFSVLSFKEMNEAALLHLAEYINVDISINDIKAGKVDKIKAITGESVEIGRYIRDYSLHSVVQSQSFDLGKIGKYYSNLVMSYAARQEALPILEIMKQHYESISKPKTNNLGKGVYNANHEKYEMTGLRTNAIRQMDDWFERVVLDNYGPKQVGEFGFKSKGNKVPLIGKTIYSAEERKKLEEIDELLKTETNDKTIKELGAIREKLGRARTATALFDNMWNWIRTMRLGYNLSSATTNFLEGVTSNMILAADGQYFDPKEIYYGYNIVKSSFLKNATFGKLETGLARRNRKLMDKFNVIMDSKNELQKSSVKSYASKLSWLNPHELNQRVEFINQSPIMVAMLRTEKIKDQSGTESSVWNAMNNDGHLKDSFKTEENIKNWEELSGETYLTFKQKLHKVIVLGHGNYDQLRGMMVKSSTAGKAVAMFKTWIPQQLYWRLATEQDDIQAGRTGFKGRYWSYGTGSGALHGAAVGTTLFGPVGGIAFGLAGAALGKFFGTDSGVGILRETIVATKQLAKKMIGMPVNLLSGRRLVGEGNKEFDQWIGKGKFNEQDARNLRANMADISLQLAWLALILVTKSIFWDDDKEKLNAKIKDADTDEEIAKLKADYAKDRAIHNILVNKLMQLSSQAAMYVNPVDTYGSTVGSNAVIQYCTDLGKEIYRVSEWVNGRDIIQSGVHAGESGLANQSYKTFMPGIFKDNILGFKSQAEDVFEDSPFHPYFKSDRTVDKESNKRDRAERRLELEGEGKTDKEILDILNRELPTPNKLEKLDMTRDEYEESLQPQE